MLKVWLCSVLLIISNALLSQSTFQTIIDKNDPSSPSFTAESITEALDGSIYAVGSIYPGGSYSKTRLIKLDQNGNLLWDTIYAQTPEHEFSPEILATPDGGVIYASDSYSYPLQDKDTIQDILIWKISSTGAIEWQKVFSARNFVDMSSSDGGGFILTASIHEEQFNKGGDIVVYKIDSQGNEIWSSNLGIQTGAFPYEREHPISVKQIDDQIYVCGYHNHDGWIETDGLLYCLDTSGTLIWDIYLPHTSVEPKIMVNSIFKFDDRFYFNTYSLFEFNSLTGDYWEIPDSTAFGAIGQVTKGYNFNVFCGIDKIAAINLVDTTYHLRLYDDILFPYYEKEVHEVSGTLAEMIPARDGGYLLLTTAGGFEQVLQITKTDCLGNIDFWSEDCDSKVQEDDAVVVYPNPSLDEILIESTFDFNEAIIYSINGEMIRYINTCSCPRMTLNISELAAGVYTVRISDQGDHTITRFVKI